MRTLRICLTAFLGGVLLASCGRTITAPPAACFARGVDTLWMRNAAGDSVPAIVVHGGGC